MPFFGKFILVLLCLTSFSLAQETQKEIIFTKNGLSESRLKSIIEKSYIPTLMEIEAQFQQIESQELEQEGRLTTKLFSSYDHQTTNERAINPFMPIFNSANTYAVGLSKGTRYGVNAQIVSSLDDRTGQSDGGQTFRAINTYRTQLSFDVDLWRDFLGAITKRQLNSLALQRKAQEIKKKIETHTFWVGVRKLYWNLVAINEKKVVAQKLYDQSVLQRQQAKKRRASGISDESEVASYGSQVYARKALLLNLNYQENQLVKSLKELVPHFNSQAQVTLANLDVDKVIDEVMACTMVIGSQDKAPLDYTDYDEYLKILREIEDVQLKLNQADSSGDLKLKVSAFHTGVGSDSDDGAFFEGSSSLAFEDVQNNDRTGGTIGVSFTIPLGDTPSRSIEVKEKYQQKRTRAMQERLLAQIQSSHQQTKEAIFILNEVLQSQKKNSELLSIKVKAMERKFRQARITLQQLLMDQDAELDSQLAIIDSKLIVITTLLDYFVYYINTPCEFNQKLKV